MNDYYILTKAQTIIPAVADSNATITQNGIDLIAELTKISEVDGTTLTVKKQDPGVSTTEI